MGSSIMSNKQRRSMMSTMDLEQARTLARMLAKRVQDDPAFAQRIVRDPVTTLTRAGLPADFVDEFLERAQLSEVQGYLSPSCGLTVIM
jgi:CO dehydrogenase/acetyl-CoA synthase delta subunit